METSNFNPNGIGLDNGHFIGLPTTELEASVVVISIPHDVTVSYADGTSRGPENVLNASTQLDLALYGLPDVWKAGIFVRPSDPVWLAKNEILRKKAIHYINFLASGGNVEQDEAMGAVLQEINQHSIRLNNYVYEESKELLSQGKIPAVLGGEHSCPLGLLKALAEKHGNFGVLHVDAHMDLRDAYEGFTYSHASIYNNAIAEGYVKTLVQVGIRDFCEQELQFGKESGVVSYFDEGIRNALFEGKTWKQLCDEIVLHLPEKVYISFDIDGLMPNLCPNTGTPVPGGLEFAEAIYLLKQVTAAGKTIIGFDLCEVAGSEEWDGNVGARVLYNLFAQTALSNRLL